MVRRLYIEDVSAPWVVWDKAVYKLQEINRGTAACNIQFYGIEVVVSPWSADLFWLNRNAANIRDHLFVGADVFMYVDTIGPSTQHELECLHDVKYADDQNWTVVTESLSAYEKLMSLGLKNEPWLWRKPSRISTDQMLDEVPLTDREHKIVCVYDAGNPLSHSADLVKAYLGAVTILGESSDVIPPLQIFSHTDLPFEPFNEILFEGMKPTKKVIKEVSSAALFIHSGEQELYPTTLMEAAQLGVPCIQYAPTDSPLKQHLIFPDNPAATYSTVEELTAFIVDHFTRLDDLDYMNDTINAVKNVVVEESTDFGVSMFLTELSRRTRSHPFCD